MLTSRIYAEGTDKDGKDCLYWKLEGCWDDVFYPVNTCYQEQEDTGPEGSTL